MKGLRVACIGGGPGNLFLARLLKLWDPTAQVTVYERNPLDATFGFGIVFSDRTLKEFVQADPETHERLIEASTARWTDMELRFRGSRPRYSGFGFTAIDRRPLLRILTEQATRAGAEVRFDRPVELDDVRDADVVVGADGLNSSVRAAIAAHVQPSIEIGAAKYIWFATAARFDAMTFPFVTGQHGTFAAHAYPYSADRSCFVVEADTETWQRAGMAESTETCQGPGESDEYSRAYLEELFADHLGTAGLLVNQSRWANFRTVSNARWSHENVVLLGDAAHTAHFSVGSGTKMAMEDAMELASQLGKGASIDTALRAYEAARRPHVERTQTWAHYSQRWWETFSARMHLEPEQFGYHFITRTHAIDYRALQRRSPDRLEAVERWFAGQHAEDGDDPRLRHALAQPVRLSGALLPNRIVVDVAPAAPDTVRAIDVWAPSRAGAGLVLVDLTGGPATATAPDFVASTDPVAAWHHVLDSAWPAQVGVRITGLDQETSKLAAAVSFAVVDLVLGDADAARLDAAAEVVGEHRSLLGDDVVLMVSITAPPDSAWDEGADSFLGAIGRLRDCGADVLRIGRPVGPGDGIAHLELLDRIRTEQRLATCATVESGWSVPTPAVTGPNLVEQLHIALLSGRIDLVAGWPIVTSLAEHASRT